MRAPAALSALLLLAGASPAFAGGFYLQEQSPAGVGRAFAGEGALAHDASTVFYNPAGMTRLQRSTITAGAHALFVQSAQENRGTTRSFPGGAIAPVSGGDGGNPFDDIVPVPAAYGAFSLTADDRLWFGLGFSAPFGLKVSYDDGWFGRYDSIHSELKTVNIQPSLAYALTDNISIGAGVDIQTIDAELTSALPNLAPALPDGHLSIEGDDMSFGWNAGILADVGPVRVGAHYRSRVEHELGGNVTISGLLGPLAGQNGSRFGRAPITTPDIASLSLAYGIGKPLRLLATANWYNWSLFESITVHATDGRTLVDSEQNYKDTWGFHGAVEYDLSPALTLRAGAAYDQTPTRDAFRTTRVPDGDRTWVTGGATYRLNDRFEANLSYAHVFVTAEDLNRTDTLFAGTPAATSVNIRSRNTGNVDILAASLTARF